MRLEKTTEHKAVKKKDEKALKKDFREGKQLFLKFLQHRQVFIKMLTKFNSTWDGPLGRINVSKYGIYSHNDEARLEYFGLLLAGLTTKHSAAAETNQMLVWRIIKPATIEWVWRIMLAAIKDGSLRFCVNYRKLNAVAVRHLYILSYLGMYIDSLGGVTEVSTLDADSTYWKIEMDEYSREKRAFISRGRQYRYRGLPIRLKNALALSREIWRSYLLLCAGHLPWYIGVT